MGCVAPEDWDHAAMANGLGPVVLLCHDRPWVDRELARGQRPWAVFLLVPIAASLCISGWALLVFALVVWLVGLDRFLSKPALWGVRRNQFSLGLFDFLHDSPPTAALPEGLTGTFPAWHPL